jgi:hypothetical protein
MRISRLKFLPIILLHLLTIPSTSPIIYSYFKENIMKKEKVKKVVKTKATLVAELEQVCRVNKGFLNSLERANAETIKRLTELLS